VPVGVLRPLPCLGASANAPPALPQVPPHGAIALRAASRLAVSLRSAGSVAAGVQSGVSESPSPKGTA
jgi:hypothetical protein